jgi:hypothetical protein
LANSGFGFHQPTFRDLRGIRGQRNFSGLFDFVAYPKSEQEEASPVAPLQSICRSEHNTQKFIDRKALLFRLSNNPGGAVGLCDFGL